MTYGAHRSKIGEQVIRSHKPLSVLRPGFEVSRKASLFLPSDPCSADVMWVLCDDKACEFRGKVVNL